MSKSLISIQKINKKDRQMEILRKKNLESAYLTLTFASVNVAHYEECMLNLSLLKYYSRQSLVLIIEKKKVINTCNSYLKTVVFIIFFNTMVIHIHKLGLKHTGTANFLNLLLSNLGKEFCLHNNWLIGKITFSQNFVITLKIIFFKFKYE